MKRVKAACICQTLHFMLKDDFPQEVAAVKVREEVAHYKKGLERNHTAYKLIEETTQPDGSVIIKSSVPIRTFLAHRHIRTAYAHKRTVKYIAVVSI